MNARNIGVFLILANVFVYVGILTVGLSLKVLFKDRVLPNTYLRGVDLSYLKKGDARNEIEKILGFGGELNFVWKEKSYLRKNVSEMGQYDLEEITSRALTGNLLGAFRNKTIEPVFVLNELAVDELVEEISALIEIEPINPNYELDEATNQIRVLAGEDGLRLDKQSLERELLESIIKGRYEIPIPTMEIKTKLSDREIEKAIRRAEGISRDAKVTISTINPEKSWELLYLEILGLIGFDEENAYDIKRIEDYILGVSNSVDRAPENASLRFINANKIEEFRPAREGVRLIKDTAVNRVVEALNKIEKGSVGENVAFDTETLPVEVGNADVNNLGIKEKIGTGESWYVGSITNRIFNLQKAAKAIDGTVVPPGGVFSFNKTVGEISSATGYKSAFIIKDGKTILGDGGGVCQVSTTLFRAALSAGLPIEQRHAHAYRVSYYEQNYQPGFDATIFQPNPDFQFRNDTPAYLLIQAEIDESKGYLALNLYGTSDGRKAEISKARVQNVISPPPDLYIDDPTLNVGILRQTERKANGARVVFDWKVTRGGEVLQDKSFVSVYRPWQAVYLRGTKTN